MGVEDAKSVEYLVVDTTAFIQNVPLQEISEKMITCQEVVDEIVNKRQLRRLVVLPYDLHIKEVFPENIKIVTEFAKKTGDYGSLSATDIKVIALTYQLEKEHVGVEHIRNEPIMQTSVKVTKNRAPDMKADVTGFYLPGHTKKEDSGDAVDDELAEKIENLECVDQENDSNSVLPEDDAQDLNSRDETRHSEDSLLHNYEQGDLESDDNLFAEDDVHDFDSGDDDSGWITPSNVKLAKKQVQSELMEAKHVKVACMTTDFAMQNVLKQMNLNVAALDGRVIKQLRTFILRCYTCFKTTSVMTKQFCPKCGHNTLKKVAVSLDEEGKMQIHINARKPLTARGKKFSLPRMKGGKHPNNPVLVEDHPMPQNHASKLARTKINPLDDDYIAGFSPFAMRDVTSRSAQLCIRPGQEMKHWMRKNPNEARRRRK